MRWWWSRRGERLPQVFESGVLGSWRQDADQSVAAHERVCDMASRPWRPGRTANGLRSTLSFVDQGSAKVEYLSSLDRVWQSGPAALLAGA